MWDREPACTCSRGVLDGLLPHDVAPDICAHQPLTHKTWVRDCTPDGRCISLLLLVEGCLGLGVVIAVGLFGVSVADGLDHAPSG